MPVLKQLAGGMLLLSTTLLMNACSKDENQGKARIQVALTDDPGDFKAVYIDVQEVNVNYKDNDDSGWQTLPGMKKGRYNLLTLVNDKDTVLADAEITSGTIKEIRLVLGDDNWVVTNGGDSIKLQTPSGQSSGVKLKINMSVSEGILYKLLLDFDVAKSVHAAGNAGKYILKPVIRTVLEAQGGSIQGVVLPAVLPSAVLVLNGTDTIASTYSGVGGAYVLKGITAGTYALHYISVDSTLQPAVKQSVVVETGKVTKIDTLTLVK
jgi:major membrane immunogen (membrane-anchored lipoprotein)